MKSAFKTIGYFLKYLSDLTKDIWRIIKEKVGKATKSKKLFVFVLMPFLNEFDHIYVGIEETCEQLEIQCSRVDKQPYYGQIIDRIQKQIKEADIIIADMTGQNPNVFYETGFAHALNKDVIHLTQNSSDIPFDVMHIPHIVYKGSVDLLKNDLKVWLNFRLEHPRGNLTRYMKIINDLVQAQSSKSLEQR